jgi:hypothetical protein
MCSWFAPAAGPCRLRTGSSLTTARVPVSICQSCHGSTSATLQYSAVTR